MKTEVEHNSKKGIQLPSLMISDLGFIILCTGVNEDNACLIGTVVSESSYQPLGYHSINWSADSFEKFNGIVKLISE